ncbi:MAG: anti-sigma factor domain-containing protein, partial [Acidimicrobiales bacterium]
LGAAALVAAAAAAAVLGLQVSHLESRVAHLQVAVTQGGVGGLVEAALAEPGTRRLELRSPSRAPVAEVVVRSNGQAFLVDARMPDLASGRTYQLWGLSGSHPVSLGLLGRKAQATVFRVDDRISTLMVTAEPAGGVSLPDSPVLATVRLAAD